MATKQNEKKREIIGEVIEEYKIRDGKDLQEALELWCYSKKVDTDLEKMI